MFSGYLGTNFEMEASIETLRSVQQPINEAVGLAEYLVPLRKKRTTRKPVNRTRARDCGRWIKKNNFRLEGITNRRRYPEGHTCRLAMAPLNLRQHQHHHVHLMSRVLNTRTNASPFTLVLDDLNQRALPFVGELVRRGLSRNVNVVVMSFETTRFPAGVRHMPAHTAANGAQLLQQLTKEMEEAKESLVVVDSLYDLLQIEGIDMNELFNLVAGKFASTLVGVYHQDMLPAQDAHNPYAPQPLELLKYLATSIITCKSFAHVLAAKAARERSLPEPTYGLLQGAEGVVECLDANDHRGIVLEAEFRRKSGRPESETYFLRTARPSDYNAPIPGMVYGTLRQEFVVLLEQEPAYSDTRDFTLVNAIADEVESTFNLGLTDKQKQAREGVVLPYFDAQKGEGGEGGRILYDMGAEDDFDEEEDEI